MIRNLQVKIPYIEGIGTAYKAYQLVNSYFDVQRMNVHQMLSAAEIIKQKVSS